MNVNNVEKRNNYCHKQQAKANDAPFFSILSLFLPLFRFIWTNALQNRECRKNDIAIAYIRTIYRHFNHLINIAWRFNSAIRCLCACLFDIFMYISSFTLLETNNMVYIQWKCVLCHNHDFVVASFSFTFELIHVVYAFNLLWNGHVIALYTTINNQTNLPRSLCLSFIHFFIHSFAFDHSHISVLFRRSAFHSNLIGARYYLHFSPLFKIEFHTLWIKFIQ